MNEGKIMKFVCNRKWKSKINISLRNCLTLSTQFLHNKASIYTKQWTNQFVKFWENINFIFIFLSKIFYYYWYIDIITWLHKTSFTSFSKRLNSIYFFERRKIKHRLRVITFFQWIKCNDICCKKINRSIQFQIEVIVLLNKSNKSEV